MVGMPRVSKQTEIRSGIQLAWDMNRDIRWQARLFHVPRQAS